MLRNTVIACWTKEDVIKSLTHAVGNREKTITLSTESSQYETKQNVVKWVTELGHTATIAKDGSVSVLLKQ
jgi:hypothetical protein